MKDEKFVDYDCVCSLCKTKVKLAIFKLIIPMA